MHLCQ